MVICAFADYRADFGPYVTGQLPFKQLDMEKK
jgi:hypothetical protein